MLLYADDLVLLAPDSQSLEAALLVVDQVARKWAMSVNYGKTIGVVVTPPPAATQGDQPASAVVSPGIQVVPTGWRSKAASSTWAASRKGTGGRTGRSRAGSMQPAKCSGHSKSQYSRPTTWRYALQE